MQSSMLEFDSSAFAIIPGEDEETNPQIYGKTLAQWLAEQLRATGIPAGDVFAEDFGWCVPVEATSHALYVVCASMGDESMGEQPTHWGVFAFAEGGLWARLRGKDTRAETLASLFATVRRCLESTPTILGLREEPTSG